MTTIKENTQTQLHYPPSAKDVQLNAARLLNTIPPSTLNEEQVAILYYASALTTKNPTLIQLSREKLLNHTDESVLATIESVVMIMASNNVYYRYIHVIDSPSIKQLPAGLRMQGLQNNALGPINTELCGLAASAINNCGLCMQSHTNSLIKHGVDDASISHCIKIAATANSQAQMLATQ